MNHDQPVGEPVDEAGSPTWWMWFIVTTFMTPWWAVDQQLTNMWWMWFYRTTWWPLGEPVDEAGCGEHVVLCHIMMFTTACLMKQSVVNVDHVTWRCWWAVDNSRVWWMWFYDILMLVSCWWSRVWWMWFYDMVMLQSCWCSRVWLMWFCDMMMLVSCWWSRV